MQVDDVQIQYPELRIFVQPDLIDSNGNAQIGEAVYRIYERFDDICHFQEVRLRSFLK